MPDAQWIRSLDESHLDALMKLYSQTWWTEDRDRETVRRSLTTSSILAGLALADGRLVTCVRVLTDWHSKAIVMDLIVSQDLRSHGLGRSTLAELLADPKLNHVRDIELYCEDSLAPYDGEFGFHQPQGTCFMRLSRSQQTQTSQPRPSHFNDATQQAPTTSGQNPCTRRRSRTP